MSLNHKKKMLFTQPGSAKDNLVQVYDLYTCTY